MQIKKVLLFSAGFRSAVSLLHHSGIALAGRAKNRHPV